MSKVNIGGSPMVLAKNPWGGQPYLRRAVKWDDRVEGYRALSDRQKNYIENEFVPVAKETGRNGRIYRECQSEGATPGRMSMNVCRVKKVSQALRGRGQSRRSSRPSRPSRPTRREFSPSRSGSEYKYAPLYGRKGKKRIKKRDY